MSSRAPLFAAAALFAVGIVGLFATVPGHDAGSAFIPFLRSDPSATPASAPVLARELEFPPTTPTPVATAEAERTAVSAATVSVSVAASPTPSPTPELHSAVIAAVAADDTPSPTPAPIRAIMVGTDSAASEDATGTPEGSSTPAPQTPATATPEATPTAPPAAN
jgi:hypothetical protein